MSFTRERLIIYTGRMNGKSYQYGGVNPLLVTNILTGLVVVVLTGLLIWAYMGYSDYKNNTDDKIATAVAKAKTEQKTIDEAAALEREKVPTRTFNGPADLGSVSFQYPKTWSAYTARQATNLEAYFHPDVVPPIGESQPFALRVLVEDKPYETIIKSYDSLVKKGSLRSNPVTVEGFSGIRLDGQFSKDRTGSAVIFKVRDKTLTVASDATAYNDDYDDTVLKSLKFNP